VLGKSAVREGPGKTLAHQGVGQSQRRIKKNREAGEGGVLNSSLSSPRGAGEGGSKESDPEQPKNFENSSREGLGNWKSELDSGKSGHEPWG